MSLHRFPALVPLAAILTASGCGKPSGDESPRSGAISEEVEERAQAIPRTERTPPAADTAKVVFRPPGRPEAAVAVEVVKTRRDIQLGLMYRTHLPPDAGMLFLFNRPKVQTFWMKNTIIPLDMIFVSSAMKVVGVVENAEPKTLTTRKVGEASQFVVEVNGGWARAHGVGAGSPVEFVQVPPLAPGEGDYD